MKLSIRWILILGFLGLIWGTHFITTTSSFISSQKVLNGHAEDIMENVADLAMERSYNYLSLAQRATILTKRLLGANVVSSGEKMEESLEQYFIDHLAIYPHFAGIYVGMPNGNFFYVSRNDKMTPGGFRTKIIHNYEGSRETQLIWRDKNNKIILQELDSEDTYDPRLRPWYKKALQEKQIVWTDPYVFFTSQKPGITIAGPVFGKNGAITGIVGVDIEIDELSVFIGGLKIGKHGSAYMVNHNGDLVAFPDLKKISSKKNLTSNSIRLVKIHEIDDELSRKAFSSANLKRDKEGRYILKRSRFVKFRHNDSLHHAMLKPFPDKRWPWIIVVHVPEDDYLGAIKDNRELNIWITALISVIATLIAWGLARGIIRPISNLEKEALAVKNDNFEKQFDIHSAYKEVQETADAFIKMKGAIQKTRNKYQRIFETIQDVYYEITVEGIILEISPSVKNVFGLAREELIGQSIYSYYAEPKDRDVVVKGILKNGYLNDYELTFKNREGRIFYCSINSLIKKSDDGNSTKIIGSIRNVTGRKLIEKELQKHYDHLETQVQIRTADLERTNQKLIQEIEQRTEIESALRESEEKYRNIIDSMEEAYFELDLAGNFTFFNDALCKLLAYSRDELLGMNNKDYTSPEVARKMYRFFNELYREGKSQYIPHYEVATKDKTIKIFEVTASLKRNPQGEPIGFRGVGRDVSIRVESDRIKRKLERQLQHAQRMEAIGTLAGGIAHEFNNLLMGIQSNISILFLNIKKQDDLYSNIKDIEECVDSGADLAKKLLAYARGGKFILEEINMNEVVQKTSGLFGRTKREIDIHVQYQKNIWIIKADRNQIEQVLINLYVNACQSMEPGGNMNVVISNAVLEDKFVKPYDVKPGEYVRVSVEDNGTGMDNATKQRVFEPFFTTREVGHGSGLGLASAFGIINNHDGIISLDSEIGKGSTFYIYLPVSHT